MNTSGLNDNEKILLAYSEKYPDIANTLKLYNIWKILSRNTMNDTILAIKLINDYVGLNPVKGLFTAHVNYMNAYMNKPNKDRLDWFEINRAIIYIKCQIENRLVVSIPISIKSVNRWFGLKSIIQKDHPTFDVSTLFFFRPINSDCTSSAIIFGGTRHKRHRKRLSKSLKNVSYANEII